MAVWLSSLLIWTSLMSTNHHVNAYHSYGFYGHNYRDESREDYSLPIYPRGNFTLPSEVVLTARSLQASSQTQRVDEETQRRTGTSSLLLLLLDGIVNEVKTQLSDEVVFPGPTKATRHKSRFVPEVPSECQTLGYCEQAVQYPKEHIDELLKSKRNYSFNVDELEPPEVVQRLGAPNEEEMCRSIERVIKPTIAQNRESKWYYIVNNPDSAPVQGFRASICQEARSSCSDVAHFPIGYSVTCVQKYMLRHMYALDGSGHMFQDSFRVPSCCVCVIISRNYE